MIELRPHSRNTSGRSRRIASFWTLDARALDTGGNLVQPRLELLLKNSFQWLGELLASYLEALTRSGIGTSAVTKRCIVTIKPLKLITISPKGLAGLHLAILQNPDGVLVTCSP